MSECCRCDCSTLEGGGDSLAAVLAGLPVQERRDHVERYRDAPGQEDGEPHGELVEVDAVEVAVDHLHVPVHVTSEEAI